MHGHRCTLFCSTKWAFPNTRTLKPLWNTHAHILCALDFYECSFVVSPWKHKGKWIRRLLFCVFSLHWRPRFYCHAASPEPPRRALSKKCKQSSETPRFLSPLQGHGLACRPLVLSVLVTYHTARMDGRCMRTDWAIGNGKLCWNAP